MLLVFVLAITMCTEVFAGSDSGSKDNTGKKQICINKSQKGTNYYDEDGDYTGMYLSATKFYYTGKAIKPRVWVYVDGYCLVEGQDYEVKYQNNVNIGTGRVIVTAIGDYYGQGTLEFTIRGKLGKVFLSRKTYTYNGKKKKPQVTAKATMGKTIPKSNYTVKYTKNKNAGYAKVKVVCNGKYYVGTKTRTFRIKPKKIKRSYIYVEKKVAYYKGRARKPIVSLYDNKLEKNLKKNRDYNVKYIGKRKKIGTYAVRIKMKGNYKGSFKFKFRVVPATPKVKTKPSSTKYIKIHWKKVKKAQYYKIYRWNGSKYKLYKVTKKRSHAIYRAKKNDSDVSGYVVAVTKKGKKVYKSWEWYYWEALKPAKAKIRIKVVDFGEFYVIPSKKSSYYQIAISKYKNFKVKHTWKGYLSDYLRCYNYSSGVKYVKARQYAYSNSGKLLLGPWSKVKKVNVP